jgi:hypothetical protein
MLMGGSQVGSAPASYGSTLVANPDIQNGRHNQRGGQHTSPAKNEIKNGLFSE